jgi:Outer membrane protein beta-barrel domain
MKRIFFTVLLYSLFAVGAFAQGISGGLKAGLNLANATGNDAGNTDMRIAYHFGGYININLPGALSVQPELLYNSVGAKDSQDGVDMTYKLNYFTVPVDLIYSFGNFNIQAGPQFGFLVSAKGKAEYQGESTEQDIKDYFKSTDVGVNVGLGATFGKLQASARYCMGLTKIWDADDVDVKNGVIQLSLGYRLFGN